MRQDAGRIARTAAAGGAGLVLAGAALLSLPAVPARAQAAVQAATQASPDALAAVRRQPRAYHGSVGRRVLHVGLGPMGPDGRFDGAAVLLDADGRVVASGPVRGRAEGPSCRLQITLGDVAAQLDGTCRASTLSGTLDERRRRPFDLVRFLAAKGDEHVVGEVWLAAGS